VKASGERDWDLKPHGRITDVNSALEANHRIANSLQLVSTFLSLQERETVDSAAKRALAAAAARVAAVGRFQRALLNVDQDRIDLRPFLESLCADMRVVTGLSISVSIDSVRIDPNSARYVAVALNELILNAAKHAYRDDGGAVSVTCKRSPGGFILLTVSDGGRGMPAEFEPEASSSVGMTILRATASQLNGELTFPKGSGVTARLEFPLD
jgi:two-component sensor histidine kinase